MAIERTLCEGMSEGCKVYRLNRFSTRAIVDEAPSVTTSTTSAVAEGASVQKAVYGLIAFRIMNFLLLAIAVQRPKRRMSRVK